MGRSVTVAVPATSANLGPGFDSLGIALDLTGRVTLQTDCPPVSEPVGTAERIILTAARAVYEHTGVPAPAGLQATFEGDIPVGRGLGASAVLRVGAVAAANRLLDDRLGDDELLRIAAELEHHADNAAPALFGGFQVVVWDGGAVTRVAVPFPETLRAVILVPELEMPTEESRKLLPAQLSRDEAVHNIGRAALLVGAFATGRLDALRVATQDVLHQPARARLFTALPHIIAAALEAGAVCAYLSGAGSSVLALAAEKLEAIGRAMQDAAARQGTSGAVLITGLRRCGAQVIRDERAP